jgi:hypothetical protein
MALDISSMFMKVCSGPVSGLLILDRSQALMGLDFVSVGLTAENDAAILTELP